MKTVVVNKYTCLNFDVDISRKSKWGNPFSRHEWTPEPFRVKSKEEAIEKHQHWLLAQVELIADLGELKDKLIACTCAPRSCHGDFLAKLADNFDSSAEFSDYSAFW